MSPSVWSALERDAAPQDFDVDMVLLRALAAMHVCSMASITCSGVVNLVSHASPHLHAQCNKTCTNPWHKVIRK